MALGLKVDSGRETGERSFSWGPTIEADLVTTSTRAATRLKYGVQLGYSDERTKITTGEQTQHWRVHTTDLRLLKLTALRVGGYDLAEKLRLTPYVAGGVQYVDSRQDADDERVNQFYWSPILGVGAELALTKRTSLSLDWEQNTEGGERRIERFSLELKVAVLGADEE